MRKRKQEQFDKVIGRPRSSRSTKERVESVFSGESFKEYPTIFKNPDSGMESSTRSWRKETARPAQLTPVTTAKKEIQFLKNKLVLRSGKKQVVLPIGSLETRVNIAGAFTTLARKHMSQKRIGVVDTLIEVDLGERQRDEILFKLFVDKKGADFFWGVRVVAEVSGTRAGEFSVQSKMTETDAKLLLEYVSAWASGGESFSVTEELT